MEPGVHTLAIDAEGQREITHPDDDKPDCNFDAYVARDWTNATGSWAFVWHVGEEDQPEGYWNGRLIGG